MTTTNNSSWVNEVRTDILSVPNPLVTKAVREAARKYCEETWLWTFDLDRISIVADTRSYTLTVPVAQYAEFIAVKKVLYKENGADDSQFAGLDPLSENCQDEFSDNPAWKYDEAASPSKYWVDVVERKINLYPIPTVASTSGLLVNVILKPSEASTVVPSFLYTDHKEAIKLGALEYLYGLRNASWYAPRKGAEKGAEFMAKIRDAKMVRVTGLTNKPLRVRMRTWA